MKNSNGFALSGIIIIVLILLGGGATYAYTKDSSIYDRFYSSDQQIQREINRVEKDFPDNIGDYQISFRGENKITRREECNNLEDASDIQQLGLDITGQTCSEQFRAEYRSTNDNSVVFVNLFKVSEGIGILKTYLDKVGSVDDSNAYRLVRLEDHEIFWYPDSGDYDVVMTQEGNYQSLPSGGEMFMYPGKANADNIVTTYFLEAFRPFTIPEY